MNADALEEELEFVDGVVPEELVKVVGEVGRGEGTTESCGDEGGEGCEGVLGDFVSVGVRDAASSVEVVSEGLLALCYRELLVLPRDRCCCCC